MVISRIKILKTHFIACLVLLCISFLIKANEVNSLTLQLVADTPVSELKSLLRTRKKEISHLLINLKSKDLALIQNKLTFIFQHNLVVEEMKTQIKLHLYHLNSNRALADFLNQSELENLVDLVDKVKLERIVTFEDSPSNTEALAKFLEKNLNSKEINRQRLMQILIQYLYEQVKNDKLYYAIKALNLYEIIIQKSVFISSLSDSATTQEIKNKLYLAAEKAIKELLKSRQPEFHELAIRFLSRFELKIELDKISLRHLVEGLIHFSDPNYLKQEDNLNTILSILNAHQSQFTDEEKKSLHHFLQAYLLPDSCSKTLSHFLESK